MMARIALAWFLAIVAGVGWWSLRDQGIGASMDAGVVLLGEKVPLEQVETVEIRFRDGRMLEFARSDSGWRQQQPFDVGIDTFSARQIGVVAAGLESIDALQLEEGTEPSLAQLGFDPPAATITWDWGDGSHAIELGNRTLAGRAWARIGGDSRVALVDSALHQRVLDTDARLWRDRALLPDAGAGSRRILIEAGNEEMQLEHGPSGWNMTSPVQTRADDAAVADWLARAARARALGYLHDQPDDLDRFGLAFPIARVEVRGLGDAEPEVVLLGDPIGVGSTDRYAMVGGSPTIIRIDEETQRVLVPSAATLVDATGTGAVREDVARVEIRTPEGSTDFELRRDFDQWLLQEDGGETVVVETAAVERLLAQLTNARAGELAFTGYPADLEQAVVILHGFDDLPIDTVRIVRESDGGRWALENGDGVLRIFPTSFDPPISTTEYGITPR